MRGDHDLGARAQRGGADRIRVADDDVRLVTGGAQHVRPSVDADQHRLVLADVVLEPLEVGLVIRPRRDDHRLAALDPPLDLRHADAVEHQRTLVPKKLDGVRGERLELGGHPRLRLDHQVGDGVLGVLVAAGELALTAVDDAVVQPQPDPVLDRPHGLLTDPVDQRDPGPDQELRAQVGEPPGDRRGGVDHPGDLGLDQRVRGRPVHVDLVQHGDVARPDPAQQRLGSAADPRDAHDPRQALVGSGEETAELHGTDGDKRAPGVPGATPIEIPGNSSANHWSYAWAPHSRAG